jgi:hypothetical protein
MKNLETQSAPGFLLQQPELTLRDLVTPESMMAREAYHELAETPMKERDALHELDMNLQMLVDLQHRFSFMVREVKYLMKL